MGTMWECPTCGHYNSGRGSAVQLGGGSFHDIIAAAPRNANHCARCGRVRGAAGDQVTARSGTRPGGGISSSASRSAATKRHGRAGIEPSGQQGALGPILTGALLGLILGVIGILIAALCLEDRRALVASAVTALVAGLAVLGAGAVLLGAAVLG